MEKEPQHKGKKISLRILDRYCIGDLEDHEIDVLQKSLEDDSAAQDYVARSGERVSQSSFTDLQQRIAKKNGPSLKELFSDMFSSVMFKPAVGAVVTVLFVFAGFGIFHHIGTHSRYSFKGDYMHLTLNRNEEQFESGDIIPVSGSDTVSFDYRAPSDMYVWFIIREDEKDAELVNDKPMVWNAAGKTQPASQQLVMEGTWGRQQLWVLFSPKVLSPRKVHHLIEKERKRDAVEVFSFYFVKKKN